MEDAIKEAKTLIGSLGTYARLVVVGVWFPGFLIFCELSYIFLQSSGPSKQGPFEPFAYAAERIKEFDSSIVSTLVVIFILASSIALGYVARDIAFAISDFWLRHNFPPARTIKKLFGQISLVYGGNEVDAIARNYNVFRIAYGELDVSLLPRSPESYVREFCKKWLSVRAPSLNTEGLEIEINMVIGLVLPIVLSSVVFLVTMKLALAIVFAISSVLAATFMMYRITFARNLETEEAIVNFLFAHWVPLPQAEPPSESEPQEDEEIA
jgi:hypothetical protein